MCRFQVSQHFRKVATKKLLIFSELTGFLINLGTILDSEQFSCSVIFFQFIVFSLFKIFKNSRINLSANFSKASSSIFQK